ncbi:MAG: hypothetical protein IK140_03660 [Clostridia bacterium]|nr:hypothetical protein [Clostridia bacterium]
MDVETAKAFVRINARPLDVAYRLRGNVLAPSFADRRHDSLGLQELLIVALHDARVDLRHFQRAYERVDIILYKGDNPVAKESGPASFPGTAGPDCLSADAEFSFNGLLYAAWAKHQ